MMVMDNIAFFNTLTLALFADLYAAFPTPKDVDVKALATKLMPADVEYADGWNALQAAEDAISFLTEEGFLTHQGSYLEGGTFLKARLTLKGLAILGSTPDALGDKKPLIERIKAVVGGGAKVAGGEAAKQLTQHVFAAAIASGPALFAALAK